MPKKQLTNKEYKNPLPKEIKDITLSFDVSTTMTGFAFLMDGKPWIMANGMPSFGSVNMVKQTTESEKTGNEIKAKNREYATYGNRVFHGSYDNVLKLTHKVYEVIKPINDIYSQGLTKVGKITIVMEVSEIPNFGRFSQNLTSVRKLALYTGMVAGLIANVFDIAGYHLKDKVEMKFINPQEWQSRCGFVKKDRQFSKEQSLTRANKLIKEWGFLQPTESDDTADAINLATVAQDVRDSMVVRGQASSKAKSIKSKESRIAKLEAHILRSQQKAFIKKSKLLVDINNKKEWLKEQEGNTSQAKTFLQRKEKYEKEIEEFNDIKLPSLLNSYDAGNYEKWTKEIKSLKMELKYLRAEKVRT